MKKILLSCLIAVLFLCVLLPVQADEPFCEVEFSHDGKDTLKKGDVVTCTLTCKAIKDPGLSSMDILISYTDGLEYNNDAVTSALPSGFVMWDPAVRDGTVRVGIIDETVVSPGFEDITLTMSFTVVSDTFTSESISLVSRDIYDFDLALCEDVVYVQDAEDFVVNLPEVHVKNIGASLRLTSSPALRFGAEFDASSVEDAVFGMLVCESEKLDKELSVTTPDARAYLLTKPLFDKTYSTSAVETASLDTKYTFRPFVKFTSENTGAAYYVYFDTLERSASDVAALALEKETDSEIISLLNAVISST